MQETLFAELKRYVGWGPEDETALRELKPVMAPLFEQIAEVFYARILSHEGARKALQGGESQVGHLKVALVAWMDKLLTGPWDEDYYELRARIGRMHVRIALPQHYMMGAMNVLRHEFNDVIYRHYRDDPGALRKATMAKGKILDLELAIMLHTYREDLLSQQARVERLATFGQLVGSIGHELRNPLGVIESSLFILKGRIGNDERANKHTQRISEQLALANDIVTKLLDMIRDRPLSREPVEVAKLLQEAGGSLAWPTGVSFRVDVDGAVPTLPADAVQLRQVFVNLLENGLHAASPDGGVAARARRNGDFVEVSVEDTGPGVDPSIGARLFEPLITTKAKGIGLGLALVKRIVERHGGTISHQPVSPHGAKFVVRLPIARQET